MQNETQWNRIKASISVNMQDLDEHIMQLPSLLMEAAEFTALAIRQRDQADHDLKVTSALVADGLRQEHDKISEAKINSMLPMDEDYNNAREKLEQLKADASLWQALVDAIRTKQSALKMITELLIAGYLTKATVASDARAELAAQRQAARERTRV